MLYQSTFNNGACICSIAGTREQISKFSLEADEIDDLMSMNEETRDTAGSEGPRGFEQQDSHDTHHQSIIMGKTR